LQLRILQLIKRTTVPINQKTLKEILTTRLDDLVPDNIIKMNTTNTYKDGLMEFSHFLHNILSLQRNSENNSTKNSTNLLLVLNF